MKLSTAVANGAVILLVLAVAAMLFGQAAGQPVLLGYVETGSMAPTMEPGDGFVAIPSALTGPPEQGDVVVFVAEELQGGGLTTHRVVGETADGYITRGDANPFTDQEGAEPPVTEGQIVSEAMQFNGQVVVIPGLGTTVTGFQGILQSAWSAVGIGAVLGGGGSAQSLVVVGLGIIAIGFVVDAVGGNRPESRRSRRRSNYIKTSTFLIVLSLVVLAPATASMMIPSGTTSFDIVSSESPNENPLVIGVGEDATVEYRVANDGIIPVLTVIEPRSPSLTVSQSTFLIPGRSEATTTLQIRAPDTTGAYTRSISEWRYLPILPRSIILALHAVHPIVAVFVIDLVLLVTAVTSGLIAVGFGPIRMRSTGRNITVIEQLKRRLF
ncbi:S26 family signal peptidase [Halobellus captivus]|uniref:S26 family signal peptidase n=1 Tax=Halobellus captivus TaxID=2592614 RepID=UPI001EF1602B|nr:S26 family signal peptidase [Halobellus captivus]